MANITWVHLSDWHQRGVDFDREVVRDALVHDLTERTRNISEDLSRIDFVVFSGDLAFSGKPEEYRVARREFIEPVLTACGLVDKEGPALERFFMVPGNHDVDRDLTSMLRTDLRFFANRTKLVNALTSDHARELVLAPMNAYARFVREDLSGAGGNGCTEYGFHNRLDIDRFSVSIIGLNTAWLCGTNKDSSGEVDDYGNIIAGEMQLEHALRGAERSDLVIGVMHHPFHWLALKSGVDDRVKIRNRLMSECHLILHGHEHEPAVSVQSGTYGNCVVIPCGSAYDRRDAANAMFANCYNFCSVNLDDRQGRVFMRRFDGDRYWLPDVRTARPNADGSVVFELPLKTEEDATRVAKTTERKNAIPGWIAMPSRSRATTDPTFVTSRRPESAPTIASDVLRGTSGGISINVYLPKFGVGMRHLVNNRYVFAHAVSTSSPYSNVVSVARGPRQFSETEITRPAWKVWIKNDSNDSMLLMIDDTEEIAIGWHNFILRWDHSRPILELLLDGKVTIAEAGYLRAWPTRFMTDVILGTWPRHSPNHYVETCIAGWTVLGTPFDDALVNSEVVSATGLPPCNEQGKLKAFG